eukprot:scaffold79954_cov54-Phaeocystis_antarctica.AAC.2
MSARPWMRLRGESRFCRAHGVWQRGVRHRGSSIRASFERVVRGREIEGDGMRRGSPGARSCRRTGTERESERNVESCNLLRLAKKNE